jgi:C_GCAxxG_C_C family probable redox protein
VTESKGIQSDIIPKIATGFCGGVSRTCGMCGAVSGAIMALNIFYGRNRPNEPTDENYIAVRKLLDNFEKRFRSSNCKELTGCDLGTKEGHDTFISSQKLIEQCKEYVEEATIMAMSIIEERS